MCKSVLLTNDAILTTFNKLSPAVIRSATAVLPLWSIYLPSRCVLTCLWSIVDIWDRESLLQNPKSLQVALEDLHSFDDALSERLRRMPAEYLPLVIPLTLIFHFTLRLLFLWRSKNGLPPFEDMLLTLHLACQWRRTNSAAMSTVFFLNSCICLCAVRGCSSWSTGGA